MLQAAVEAAREKDSGPQILAVSVLTSMDDQDLNEIGVHGQVVDQVVWLASLALEAGCAGVVSSPREVKTLREKLGSDFLAIAPGVRPAGAEHGDQARVTTPREAIAAGATHIVVGRPITEAANPAEAAAQILQELGTHPSALQTQHA